MGILNFLLQWTALNQIAKISHLDAPYNSQPLHTKWGLIHDFQDMSAGEIEGYLPQICNILIADPSLAASLKDERMLSYMENIIADKCDSCLPFGLKLSGYLKACCTPLDGFVSAVRSSSVPVSSRDSRLKDLIAKSDSASERGARHSGVISRPLKRARIVYFHDFNFLMSKLIQLGEELKFQKAADRLSFLRDSLEKCNQVLLRRVLSRGEPGPDLAPCKHENRDSKAIVELFADYGIHYPLQLSSTERVLRILRLVSDESVMLPSKERFPFLVFAEVLEMGYNGSDTRTFYQAEPNLNAIEVDSDLSDYSGDYPFDDQIYSISATTPVSVMVANIASTVTPQEMIRGGSAHGSDELSELGSEAARVRRMPTRPSFLKSGDMFDKNRPAGTVNTRNIATDKQNVNNVLHEQGDRAAPHQDSQLPTTWAQKKELIRSRSPYGSDPRWDLKAFIVKTGTTLRREVLAMQLINAFKDIFAQENVDIELSPYRILCTGATSGLIEYLSGTQSVDNIKKLSQQHQVVTTTRTPSKSTVETSSRRGLYGRRVLRYSSPVSVSSDSLRSTGSNIYSGNGGSGGLQIRTKFSLKDYFETTFGPSYSPMYARALDNFVRSLAGYSLVTYVLQLKDRHNANILINENGSIIHIDFGYILGESPGFNMNFENAPFKLTQEYIDIMGGIDSPAFRKFKTLFYEGFQALQTNVDILVAILELYDDNRGPCLAEALRARIHSTHGYDSVTRLISESLDSWRTKQYDWFQWKTNNIQV